MATVLLARDTGLKRLVAVKALRAELSEDPVCRKRFEREAQTAARLCHANIPAIYAVGRLGRRHSVHRDAARPGQEPGLAREGAGVNLVP